MQSKIFELLNSKLEKCKGTSDVIYYDQLESLSKELNSLFSLQGVSHRRELLIAYEQTVGSMDINEVEKEVDNYLKAISSS